MKALVTGATGFVGPHIVRALLREGWSVRALVRSAKKAQTLLDPQVELFEGDLVDRVTLDGVGAGVDAVFHAAAQVAAAADYLKTNLDGTRNLVEALRPSGPRRFVHISSVAVTGMRGAGRIDENYVCKPELPYAVSKLKVDEYLQREAREHNFPAVIVRPPTVYGPGERYNFLTLCRAIQDGRFLLIGSGQNRIDFCWVGNLVQVMLRAAVSGRPGEVYLVADDPALPFAESTAVIGELVGRPVSRLHLPRPLAYAAAYAFTGACRLLGRPTPLSPRRVRTMSGDLCFNLDKARRELGYQPEGPFREMVGRTIEWYRGQGLLK